MSVEQQKKADLIKEIVVLQNTLEDLSSRVESVVTENGRLRTENDVLGQYIEDLMKQNPIFNPHNAIRRTSNISQQSIQEENSEDVLEK